MTNYKLKILRNSEPVANYNVAINILDTYTKHYVGQPVAIIYLDEQQERHTLLAMGKRDCENEKIDGRDYGPEFYDIINKDSNSPSTESDLIAGTDIAIRSAVIQGEDFRTINVSNGEQFKTTVACGNLSAGQTVEAGESIFSLMRRILVKTLNPAFNSNPTINFTYSGDGPGDYEIGTSIDSSISVDPTTIQGGSIKEYGTSVEGTIRAIPFTYNPTKASNDSYSGTLYSSKSIQASYQFETKTVTDATDSDGNYHTISVGGNTVYSTKYTFNPRYRLFYGMYDTVPASYSRSNISNVKLLKNGTDESFDLNFNKNIVSLLVPKETETGKKWMIENAYNTQTLEVQLISCKKYSTPVSIKDVSEVDRDYYVYQFTYDSPLNAVINIQLIYTNSSTPEKVTVV